MTLMTGVGSLFVYIGSGQQPGYSNTAVVERLTHGLIAATEKKKKNRLFKRKNRVSGNDFPPPNEAAKMRNMRLQFFLEKPVPE